MLGQRVARQLVDRGSEIRVLVRKTSDTSALRGALGVTVQRRHVPRPALAAGAKLLRRIKPNLASVMGQSLFADRWPSQADDAPLKALEVEPTPASTFIRQVVNSG